MNIFSLPQGQGNRGVRTTSPKHWGILEQCSLRVFNSKTLQTIQLELLSHPVFGSFNPHHCLPIECRYEVMCGYYWNSYFPTNYSYPFLLCLYKLRTKDYVVVVFYFIFHATQKSRMMFKGRSLSFEYTFKMNVNTILLIFLKLYFSESVLLVWVLKK